MWTSVVLPLRTTVTRVQRCRSIFGTSQEGRGSQSAVATEVSKSCFIVDVERVVVAAQPGTEDVLYVVLVLELELELLPDPLVLVVAVVRASRLYQLHTPLPVLTMPMRGGKEPPVPEPDPDPEPDPEPEPESERTSA
jgi:hypothetical protein